MHYNVNSTEYYLFEFLNNFIMNLSRMLYVIYACYNIVKLIINHFDIKSLLSGSGPLNICEIKD